jgi:hypothetical protein
LLRNHYEFAVLSLFYRFEIAMQTPREPCTITKNSLCIRFEITVRSIRDWINIVLKSQRNRYSMTAQ